MLLMQKREDTFWEVAKEKKNCHIQYMQKIKQKEMIKHDSGCQIKSPF